MPFIAMIFLAVWLILGFSPQHLPAQTKPDFSKYEYHVTEDGTFGLYKPKGWKVGTQRFPNGRMVFLTDPKDLSYVNVIFLEKIDPQLNSVTFAGATLRNVQKQMPGLKIVEAKSSRDRLQTVVKFQRSGPKKTLIEGKYTFNVKHPTAAVCGYEAPARQFKEMLPTLLTVIANITILDDQAYQRLAAQRKGGPAKIVPMNKRSAPDGTCWLLVPQGWNLTAGKGAALCASPDGDIGYLFTVINFVGQSRLPYFNSSNIPGDLRYNYMQPTEALIVASRHLGSSNHRVLERHANPSWAAQATAALNRKADAEICLISYKSKNGAACIGYFDILGFHPLSTGQWSIMPTGFWAPESQFARYLPSLMKIAESYGLNEKWAADYVRQGMENVRRLMKQTSSMMSRYAEEMRQSSLAAHQERMRSQDFISYKFSTYMRGVQEWVTGLEGGKIYQSDHWGLSSGGETIAEGPPFNYYNYRGDYEYGHIAVDSSREVYEAIKGR
jgi:hypothetical protein